MDGQQGDNALYAGAGGVESLPPDTPESERRISVSHVAHKQALYVASLYMHMRREWKE
jgi:hypothetical protein